MKFLFLHLKHKNSKHFARIILIGNDLCARFELNAPNLKKGYRGTLKKFASEASLKSIDAPVPKVAVTPAKCIDPSEPGIKARQKNLRVARQRVNSAPFPLNKDATSTQSLVEVWTPHYPTANDYDSNSRVFFA